MLGIRRELVHHPDGEVTNELELGLSEYLGNAPTTIKADNRAANQCCQEDVVTSGNMFYQVPHYFIRECVRNKTITVECCKSQLNISDLGTKSVSKQVLDKLLGALLGCEKLEDLLKSEDKTNSKSDRDK